MSRQSHHKRAKRKRQQRGADRQAGRLRRGDANDLVVATMEFEGEPMAAVSVINASEVVIVTPNGQSDPFDSPMEALFQLHVMAESVSHEGETEIVYLPRAAPLKDEVENLMRAAYQEDLWATVEDPGARERVMRTFYWQFATAAERLAIEQSGVNVSRPVPISDDVQLERSTPE